MHSHPEKVLSIVEAHSVTGPMKPLLLAVDHERQFQPTLLRRVAVTTTRDPELGTARTNPFLDAAAQCGLAVRLVIERHLLDPRVIGALSRIVKEEQPDIVETHDFKSHLLYWLARDGRRGGLNKPRWVAFHHGYTRMSAKVALYQQFDRITLRRADRVVTLCRPFIPVLAKRGVDEDRIRVVTNCVAPRSRTPEEQLSRLRSELGLQGEFIIVSVGRLSPEKGHDDLFAALAQLQARANHLKWRLLIVGDGGERERLQAAAASFEGRVTFLGHQADPSAYFDLADLFVLSSHSEGSPLVVLEAMAAGAAIVATRVGGVPEILSEESALLVEPRDVAGLSAAIERLLCDRTLGRQLGAKARHAAQAHTPANYAARLHSIYRELFSAR